MPAVMAGEMKMALFKKKLSEEAKESIEVNKLEDEELENVNGGYLFYNSDYNYEVIDDKTGEVLATHMWYADASSDCERRGISKTPVSWTKVEQLRAEYKEACKNSPGL